MCLLARLAESCNYIKQSQGLQAATHVCVSCALTILSANLHDSRHVAPGSISVMFSPSSQVPILTILSCSSLPGSVAIILRGSFLRGGLSKAPKETGGGPHTSIQSIKPQRAGQRGGLPRTKKLNSGISGLPRVFVNDNCRQLQGASFRDCSLFTVHVLPPVAPGEEVSAAENKKPPRLREVVASRLFNNSS